MRKDNFFTELKRRNVYKVAIAYAVVGWLVIQVSSTVLPTFHAPEWVVQTLVVLVASGLPIALGENGVSLNSLTLHRWCPRCRSYICKEFGFDPVSAPPLDSLR